MWTLSARRESHPLSKTSTSKGVSQTSAATLCSASSAYDGRARVGIATVITGVGVSGCGCVHVHLQERQHRCEVRAAETVQTSSRRGEPQSGLSPRASAIMPLGRSAKPNAYATSAQLHYAPPGECERTLMMRAGMPATTVLGGTPEATTAPAATTAPSPIVTPSRMI